MTDREKRILLMILKRLVAAVEQLGYVADRVDDPDLIDLVNDLENSEAYEDGE